MATEFDASLQADRQQEVEGQDVIEALGQTKVAAYEAGEQAQEEKQDDGVSHRGSSARGSGRDPAPEIEDAAL